MVACRRVGDQSTVSIVVPIWNSRLFMFDAIESLLAQSHRPLEIVVVDDGSIDGGGELAEAIGPPVVVYRQAHAGIGPARNTGIDYSRGTYIGFLDADDRSPPSRLALQVAALEQDAKADLVVGQVCEVPQTLWDRTVRGPRADAAEMAPAYLPGGVLARREVFARVGPFRTDIQVGDFVDWYIRANELGVRTHVLDELVLWRRAHDSNFTRRREHFTDYVRVLHSSLARRRRAARGPDGA